MSRRVEREKLRKQAVSVTLDMNDLAFIDQGIHHKIFQSRSHAISWAVQLLRQHVAQIMKVQQEEARRIEEMARRNPGTHGFPGRPPSQGPGNPGFPPR